MKEEKFYVVSFDSTHHAIKGEKILKDSGYNIRVIPTPREVTASCGLSIKFEEKDLGKIQTIIGNNELSIKGIFEIGKYEKGRLANKID